MDTIPIKVCIKSIAPNSSTEKVLAYKGINKNENKLSKAIANPKEIKFTINSFNL